MVRLQKRFAYKYKDKEHYKYVVTIPSDTIKQLEWSPQTELSLVVSNKTLVLKQLPNQEDSPIRTVKKKERPA